jgi:hypothetical protein|tara:strand:+ start:278 stop:1240 length:963 start_codon:yes stop_codon:yes gene_type:complete
VAEKDYLAMWFNVRRKYGIQDTIYWGWYDPKAQEIDWKTWRHADADGMAGFANILRKDGFPCDPLPVCNETSVPGWREINKAQRENPTEESAKTVNWRKTYSDNSEFMPEVTVINKELTTRLYQQAKTRKVSPGNIIFSALSRVISRELIDGDSPFYWFYPVNVRGATGIKTESFNQASGLYLLVDSHSTAEDWQAQMRTRMKAKQHWKNWKLANLGKLIGEQGVSIVYKFTSGKQFYAGSCSNLGTWPLIDARNPPIEHDRQLVAVAPGTANYPVSSCMVDWNGSIALTLKLNPYICRDQTQLKKLLKQWYEEIITDIT